MATAPSLFGATPESIQQARDAALDQQASAYSQLDPFQRASAGLYRGGSQLGGAIGRMLGGQDPEMQKAAVMQQLSQQADTSTSEGMLSYARALQSSGLQQEAFQASQQAQAMQLQGAKLGAEQALTRQRDREARPAVPAELQKAQRIAFLQSAVKTTGSPEESKLLEDEYKALTAPPPETRGEFERILGSLNLPPEQVKSLKNQYIASKLNPDSSGFKGLQAQLVNLQVQTAQQKLDELKTKKEDDKTKAVNTLSGTEGNLDTVLTTAERALGLAPGGLLGASMQSLGSSIPFTDAKSLKNLVGSLNSEKAIQTLEQLKSQSRTGATGFGALSEKELQLLLDQTRSLDPTDKMFKENLTVVMDKWKGLRTDVRKSRLSLQGRPPEDVGPAGALGTTSNPIKLR
jgi:hypothetical protein